MEPLVLRNLCGVTLLWLQWSPPHRKQSYTAIGELQISTAVTASPSTQGKLHFNILTFHVYSVQSSEISGRLNYRAMQGFAISRYVCSGGSRISRRGASGPRRGGHRHPRQLRFKNVVCRNEIIWTLRGRVKSYRGTGRADMCCVCRTECSVPQIQARITRWVLEARNVVPVCLRRVKSHSTVDYRTFGYLGSWNMGKV